MKLSIKKLQSVIESLLREEPEIKSEPNYLDPSYKPSELDMARSVLSDVYKEVYGCRPRGIYPDTMSLEDVEREIERLYQIYDMDRDERVADMKYYDDVNKVDANVIDDDTIVDYELSSEDQYDDMYPKHPKIDIINKRRHRGPNLTKK